MVENAFRVTTTKIDLVYKFKSLGIHQKRFRCHYRSTKREETEEKKIPSMMSLLGTFESWCDIYFGYTVWLWL
jgi:hypothetical protein